MRTIESEFPDYDNVTLTIPPFVAVPWYLDTCPRYVWRGDTPDLAECELTLWLDYKDPAKRGNDGAPMYFFMVGPEGEGRPLTGFWGETEGELRDMLNDWYEEHVGYRPDDDVAAKIGERRLDLGELMHLVGTVVYLEIKSGNEAP